MTTYAANNRAEAEPQPPFDMEVGNVIIIVCDNCQSDNAVQRDESGAFRSDCRFCGHELKRQ